MASHLAISEGGAPPMGGVALNTRARARQAQENNANRDEAHPVPVRDDRDARMERIETSLFQLADIVGRIGGRDTVVEDTFNDQDERDAPEYIPLGPEMQDSDQGPNNDHNPEEEDLEPRQEVSDEAPDPSIRDIRRIVLTETRENRERHQNHEMHEARRTAVDPRSRNHQATSRSFHSFSGSRTRHSRQSAFDRISHREDMADSTDARRFTPPRRVHDPRPVPRHDEDLRQRLNARWEIPRNLPPPEPTNLRAGTTPIPANPTSLHIAPLDQASNERGRTTRIDPTTTPLDNTDMMTLFQELRDEVRVLRAAQTLTPDIRGMMEDVTSPFTAEILAEEFARDFRLPIMSTYDGKTDPLPHIQHYQMWMKVGRHSSAIMCQAFCLTLSGPAYQWFLKLRPGAIQSFEELQKSFLARFSGSRERKLGKNHLRTIKQRKNESLREYLSRFTEESNKVDRFEDGDAISVILDGLQLGGFLDSIIKKSQVQ